MTIHFECPYCQKGLRAPEKAAGKTARCTKCKKKLIVPEKKEVLVPGKDGKPRKVSKAEREAKRKRKKRKRKAKIAREVAQIDSEIEKQLEKGEAEPKGRIEKDVAEFESELEKELEGGTEGKPEPTKRAEKGTGGEAKGKRAAKPRKEKEPELKLKPKVQKDSKEISQEELLRLEREVDKKISTGGKSSINGATSGKVAKEGKKRPKRKRKI